MNAHRTGWRLLTVVACVGLAGTLVHSRWARGAFAAGQTPPGAQASLVPNPSFEEMDGQQPRGWKTAVFRRSAEFGVDEVAHSGKRSVKISAREGGDAAWTTIVPVKPYARYRLSGWIRTEKLEPGTSRGALLNLHGLGELRTNGVTGTRDWTEVRLEFDTEANDAVQIDCLFGGRGRAIHGLLGGLVIGAIYNGLYLLGLEIQWQLIVTGLVLLAAVSVDSLSRQGAAAGGSARA